MLRRDCFTCAFAEQGARANAGDRPEFSETSSYSQRQRRRGSSLTLGNELRMKAAAAIKLSSIIIVVGLSLRFFAETLAWPSHYSFSGARADTSWAHREAAIAEIGLALMAIGGLALAATIHAIVKHGLSTHNPNA